MGLPRTKQLMMSVPPEIEESCKGVIAATARLQRLKVRDGTQAAPTMGEVERAHRQFHLALLTGCHSKRLTLLQKVFYDQAQRYRHVMISQEVDLGEFVKVHEQLANVILKRNYAEAAAALSNHIERTFLTIYPQHKQSISQVTSPALESSDT
jgi:DNA-binding GntR family transcriptional regulator